MTNNDAQQTEINLRDYWQILVRRRWLIYTCVLVTTIAAAVSSFLATPIYKAAVTVSIERSPVRILSQDLTSSSPSWLDYQNFYNTQYRIIESERVMKLAVAQLDLVNRPGVLAAEQEGIGSTIRGLRSRVLGLFRPKALDSVANADPLRPYVALIRGGMTVTPHRDSFLVEISYVSPDPGFAAEVADAVADAYRHFTLSEKIDIAEQSREWFVEQIGDLREEVRTLETDLNEYGRRHGIVVDEDGSITRQNLSDLRNRRVQAQVKTQEMRARRDSVQQAATNPGSLKDVRDNALIDKLTAEIGDLEAEYQKLLTTFDPGYPEAQRIKAQIESKTSRRDEEITAIARRVQQRASADYDEALREERYLSDLLDSAKVDLNRFEEAMIEYETMKVELDRKRETLRDMHVKQNNMTLSAQLGDTAHNVRVIDFAKVPQSIFKPRKKLNIMLGFLFGLFLGVGASVLMEYVDNTIKTPDDVRNVIDVPVLGMIPSQALASRSRSRSRGRDSKRPKKDAKGDEVDPALVTASVPLSPVAEAYRELRTAILLATPGHPPRDLTVTSCQPSEGKTTTALNVAIALSQLGRRILVVDTDLRRPRVHQILKVNAAQGVSNFLTGFDDVEALIQPTELDRVFVLPAGPVPPNPAELLDSERFLELLGRLRDGDHGRLERFDHIIFDSPPVLSVVDPLLIGRHVEGTVLVVRSAFTSRESARLGKEKLESGRVNLLGVLLNAVQTEHVPYQYRYYRYGYAQQKPLAGDGRGPRTPPRAVAGGSRDA